MGDHQWIINLQSKLNEIKTGVALERTRRHCIYRVPKVPRDLNEDAYTPQFVSFGPYHHGKAHLKPVEGKKYMVLTQYLRDAAKSLAEAVEALRPEVQELMDSYDGLEEPWTNAERFLELMIVDGCFLLDFLMWYSANLWLSQVGDGIFADAVKLENQLPLLVLAAII